MSLDRVTKAAAAISLAVALAISPANASRVRPSQSLPQTTVAVPASGVRASAGLEGESELRGGFLIPMIALIAIILGILAATGGGGDRPHST